MFVNYGGPGGIATQDLALTVAAGAFSPDITSKFDLVALDPWGIGTSSPIQSDVDFWNERILLFPKTEAEFDRLVQHNEVVGKSCVDLSGDLVYHMDTLSVVRDFEAVRIALGDDKLNFLGISYGSQVAYQYAQLFPDNIRTLVGDGILNHAESETSSLVTETETYEDQFDRFAAWAKTNTESARAGQDVAAVVEELVQRADESPIPAGASPAHYSNVTSEDILFNLRGALISVAPGIGPGWPALSQALALSIAGNGTAFATMTAVSGDIEGNSMLFAGLAVACLDWKHSSTRVSDLRYKQLLTRNWAPHT